MDKWWVPGCTIGYEHTFINALADFLTSLETGEPVQPDFRSALRTQKVCEAVLASAKSPSGSRSNDCETRGSFKSPSLPGRGQGRVRRCTAFDPSPCPLASMGKGFEMRTDWGRRGPMNYFSHGYRFVDDPWFLAGTAVPDWLNVSDRGVRVRAKHAAPFVNDADPKVAALARGIAQHHADDAWFHQGAAFSELSWQFTARLRAIFAPYDDMRRSFSVTFWSSYCLMLRSSRGNRRGSIATTRRSIRSILRRSRRP